MRSLLVSMRAFMKLRVSESIRTRIKAVNEFGICAHLEIILSCVGHFYAVDLVSINAGS